MSPAEESVQHAEVHVDLDAVSSNVSALQAHAPQSEVMAVVKADAYGHGLVPVGKAARRGGATWLATAVLAEALTLRAAGDDGPLLCWLYGPGEDFDAAVSAGIDLTASSESQLGEIVAAARRTGACAALHLKVDTGLGRNGAMPAQWPALLEQALAAQAEGAVRLAGLWSHFAYADEPGHPTIAGQQQVFEEAAAQARRLGATDARLHLANSAATLTLPSAHYDLVRPGLAVYGLSPVPQVASPAELGLRPAMTVTARLALVKDVPAGHGVSYGHEYVTERPTRLALVPLGYADGVPRHGGGRAPVQVGGSTYAIAGRVCMDQVVLDVGDLDVAVGDQVTLFGSGTEGEPTAEDWARACDTISYEIVTRMSARLPRRYRGEG